MSDRASNIYQLESIIRNLDGTGQNDIEAISLQSSQAKEVIGLLESMSSTGAAKDIKGSRVRIVAAIVPIVLSSKATPQHVNVFAK